MMAQVEALITLSLHLLRGLEVSIWLGLGQESPQSTPPLSYILIKVSEVGPRRGPSQEVVQKHRRPVR